MGRPYDPAARDEADELFMEKVSLTLVDDLTVGDGINLFTLLEAPYRPFLTYRARVALDGPLVASGGGATIQLPAPENVEQPRTESYTESPSGRIRSARPMSPTRVPPGPEAHRIRRMTDVEPEDSKK